MANKKLSLSEEEELELLELEELEASSGKASPVGILKQVGTFRPREKREITPEMLAMFQGDRNKLRTGEGGRPAFQLNAGQSVDVSNETKSPIKPSAIENILRLSPHSVIREKLAPRSLDYVSSAGAIGGGMVAGPAGAVIGGGLGKGAEILLRKLEGDNTSTQPNIPFTSKKIPRIPGINPTLSDIAVEGTTNLAFEIPGKAMRMLDETKNAYKALGFGKLKDPKVREAALKASQTAMDTGVIKTFNNPQDMIERAEEIKETTGQAIGGYLQKVKGGFDVDTAINDLKALIPKEKGHHWDKMATQLNNAISTLEGAKAVNGSILPWEYANKIKGMFQQAADWKTNKDATVLDQKIAFVVREALDKSLDAAAKVGKSGKDFVEFMKNKKLYKDINKVEDALNNRISTELAKKSITLTDAVLLSTFLSNPGAASGVAWGAFRALAPKLNQILAKTSKVGKENKKEISAMLRTISGSVK